MREEQFRIRDGALDGFLEQRAELAGFDLPQGSIERSGFVPTFRRLAASLSHADSSAHPGDMGTQIAWVVYGFVAQFDGFHRPAGFAPKSIIAEAVDGPYGSNAIRISLWHEGAVFQTVSGSPVELERFRHPNGKPTTYVAARWALENLFELVAEETNRLIPKARMIGKGAGLRPLPDPARGVEAARKLKRLGVKGILIQAAELGYITQVACKMPECFCPEELGGACYFEPVTDPGTDWMPTHEHFPIPKREGGSRSPDNTILAHRLCNRIDYSIVVGRSYARDLERVRMAREAAVENVGRRVHPVGPTVAEPDTVDMSETAPRADQPRANSNPAELTRKQQLLSNPHMAPLTHYVERLRIALGPEAWVPYFDPTEAGVNARILILLESPGPRASGPRGSQFVSADNNDQTAENMWDLLREAGVQRDRDMVTWNVVPWYVGRAPSPDEVKAARPWIVDLISLLPELRVVLLLGKTAKKSWDGLDLDVPVIRAPHPSPQNLNTRPEARPQVLEALIEVRRVGTSPG